MGGYFWQEKGDETKYLTALQRSLDHIYFACEHTTILKSTMEGALRSGVRATNEANDEY